MDKRLNDYLERLDRHLRPLPAAERVDIVQEIKSEMLELEAGGLPPEAITERLGDPRALARAYLGEAVGKTRGWRQVCAVAAFYSLAGLGGLFVLPVTSICGLAFMLAGVICPIAGAVKLLGALLGFHLDFITIQLGAYTAGPLQTLPLAVCMGAVLFAAGWLLWRLTVGIVRGISRGKPTFS